MPTSCTLTCRSPTVSARPSERVTLTDFTPAPDPRSRIWTVPSSEN